MRAEGHDDPIALVMDGPASSNGGGGALPSFGAAKSLRDTSSELDISSLTEGEKALAAKFAAMLKAGVPTAAVVQKMASEGVQRLSCAQRRRPRRRRQYGARAERGARAAHHAPALARNRDRAHKLALDAAARGRALVDDLASRRS